MERTADPRHASCVRTCRASGRGPLIAKVRPARFGMTGAVGLKITAIQVIPRDDEAGWSPPAQTSSGCATSEGCAAVKWGSLRILW